MRNSHQVAAVYVVFEALFIGAYVCASKSVFKEQGTLFSSAVMMLFVSISLFVYSFPYSHFEKKCFEKLKRQGALPGDSIYRMHPQYAVDLGKFALWSLCAIGGDIALFLAVTNNAPLAESSVFTRGVVLLLLALGSWYFFKQTPNKKQWLGLSIGMCGSASIVMVIYLSNGGVFSNAYEFKHGIPVWLYFFSVMLVTTPAKTLLSRSLLERHSSAACMLWLNIFAIPLCLSIALFANVRTPEEAWVFPTSFWYFLGGMLVVVLCGVSFRYAAQKHRISPVYHDGLRYGIMLAIQFTYDLFMFLNERDCEPSKKLVAALFVTIGLSLLSSYILFKASKGSTKSS